MAYIPLVGKYLSSLARKLKDAIREAVYTDRVLPFIWVYYVALWMWGVYGTFFAAPPTYVKPAMGNIIYDFWVWLHIVATSAVMCSLIIENKSEQIQDKHLHKKIWLCSVGTQACGHACMFWVLLSYELSAAYATEWGDGTYSIFVISPYVIGCLLLTVQGVAKVIAKVRA